MAKAASSTAVCTCGYQGPRREEREERPCEPEAKQVSKESAESISKSPRHASQLFQSEPQKVPEPELPEQGMAECDLLGKSVTEALNEVPEPELPEQGMAECPTFILLTFASMRQAFLGLPDAVGDEGAPMEEVDCEISQLDDDTQEEMGQSDDQEEIGQSDAQEEIGQSDAQEEIGQSDEDTLEAPAAGGPTPPLSRAAWRGPPAPFGTWRGGRRAVAFGMPATCAPAGRCPQPTRAAATSAGMARLLDAVPMDGASRLPLSFHASP